MNGPGNTTADAFAIARSGARRVYIPGEPVSQGRGRAVRMGNSVRVVDPRKSRNWKAAAQQHAVHQLPGFLPFDDVPLEVHVVAIFTRPKTTYRKRKPRGREPKTTKPDADNVAKAVKDALSGVVWLDDKLVARMTIEKWIGAQGEAPGVTVAVAPMTMATETTMEAKA